MVSSRAQELADLLERANEAFVAMVEGLGDTEWRTFLPQEERTVAALCRHVAWGYAFELPYFDAIGSGQPLPSLPWSELDAVNAEQGGQFARCTKAEVLEVLRENSARAAAFVRGLDDEQLQRRGGYLEGGAERTLDWLVERVLSGHAEMHAANLRAALRR